MEIGAPKEEAVRLWERWVSVRRGVVVFPHNTRINATEGMDEYVTAIDWRRWILDSEYPLINTVI